MLWIISVEHPNQIPPLLCYSNPLVHQPKSVRGGNPSSISVLVHVNQNLEVEESAFRFLVSQVNGKCT